MLDLTAVNGVTKKQTLSSGHIEKHIEKHKVSTTFSKAEGMLVSLHSQRQRSKLLPKPSGLIVAMKYPILTVLILM